MMMMRMSVRLLALLAGSSLLSRRRRAAVLREDWGRRRQDEADENHTEKCANRALLHPHPASRCTGRPNATSGC